LTTPSLIALDWGISNLRASLLDGTGHAIETRSARGGVMAAALQAILADDAVSAAGGRGDSVIRFHGACGEPRGRHLQSVRLRCPLLHQLQPRPHVNLHQALR
jgi:2-keto-3-deoxy-galactonokinase